MNEFRIIPFPIETPHLLKDFLSTNIPIFTTICEDWNLYKNEILIGNGYRVIVLFERMKQIEGETIRFNIASGDSSWVDKVPYATKLIIEKYDIKSRLLDLAATDTDTFVK